MKTFSSVLVFVLTSVAVFVIVGLVANQIIPADIILKLDNAGILLGYLLACFSIGLGSVAVVRRQDIGHRLRQWLRRSRFENVGEQFDGKVTAIVIPVSRVQQPEWIIRWLKPKHVAFLYTALPESQTAAMNLEERFAQVTFFPNRQMVANGEFIIQDADDPSESKQRTRFFLQHFLELGIPGDQIFVDTTGGKVPMSIGAFQAAEELNISTIYVVGKDNGRITKPQKREHGDPKYISKRATRDLD